MTTGAWECSSPGNCPQSGCPLCDPYGALNGATEFVCPDCHATQPEPGTCGRCPGTVRSATPSGAPDRDPEVLIYAQQIIDAPDEWTPHYTRAELLPMAKAYVLLVECEEAESLV